MIIDVKPIHLDDIADAYQDADIGTRQAVSLLLEDESVRWWVGTLNVNKMKNAMGRDEHIGFSMYKGEPEMLHQVIAASFSPFTPQNQELYEVMESAVAVWIALTGGDIGLKRITDKVQQVLDR